MTTRTSSGKDNLLIRLDAGRPATGAPCTDGVIGEDLTFGIPDDLAKLLREPGWTLAWRGIKRAFRQDSRLVFHMFLAIVTLTIACVLELSYVEWCLVLLGVGVRFGGELWLGSIRALGKTLAATAPQEVRAAVELGAGAVSLLMFTSATMVAVILAHHLLPLLN